VLFDKIAGDNFSSKLFYIFALGMASSMNQHCASCINTFSFPIVVKQTAIFILVP